MKIMINYDSFSTKMDITIHYVLCRIEYWSLKSVLQSGENDLSHIYEYSNARVFRYTCIKLRGYFYYMDLNPV